MTPAEANHSQAMDLAQRAETMRTGYDPSAAKSLLSRAFNLERSVIGEGHWLGDGVIARSAAWLGYSAGRTLEALEVAEAALKDADGRVRAELEDVIAHCRERLGVEG